MMNYFYSFFFKKMPRDKRQKRDIHALNEDGMVMCNPRDKEAALRAETENIATYDWKKVTCENVYH
jgi:glutamate mutase epsilon subunit